MILIIAITGLIAPCATALTNPAEVTSRLRREIRSAPDDTVRVSKLFELARFYSDYLDDDRISDSLCHLAVQTAEMTHEPELIFDTYNRFIETSGSGSDFNEKEELGLKALELRPMMTGEMEFRVSSNLATVYLSGYSYDKALEYGYKCLSLATSSGNEAWKVGSYLIIGQGLEGKNQKMEAFRNYLNALSLAEKLRNNDLMIRTYSLLSRFYNLNKLHAKAINYKLLQQQIIRSRLPVDSVALVWTWYDLQEIDLNSDNNRLNEQGMKNILDFAGRWQCEKLLEFEIALIRTHYVEAEQIGKLYDLYHARFPHKMAQLKEENPGLYARLKAYFCEMEKKPDSALFYFNEAEMIYRDHPNKILQSNFYSRFGQFLLRQQKVEPAIGKFQTAYEKAEEASFFDYMLSASRQLESIYAGKKDFENAYRYAALNKILSDSLSRMTQNDRLLVMEIEHEAQQREMNTRLEQQETDRRHYLQYTAIIIIIISVFIILLMLGSLKVPEWIIRTLGFFSFIFLFEFIILIADHNIHEITHGEPWKILGIKILLIGILLPFHHWIEKKVVGFLLNPALINIARYPIRDKLKKKIKSHLQAAKAHGQSPRNQ